MSIHIFCPTFPESLGTFKMEPVEFNEVHQIVSSGFSKRNSTADAPERMHWRHSFPAVKHMLLSSGFIIESDIDRKGSLSRERMAVGDVGIVFRGNSRFGSDGKFIGKADLKDRNAQPEDFTFTLVERIA